MDDTPFFEISKLEEGNNNLYIVSNKEKADDDTIGTIDCQIIRGKLKFVVRGEDSAYFLKLEKANGSVFEYLKGCGSESKCHQGDLTIYNFEEEKFMSISCLQ